MMGALVVSSLGLVCGPMAEVAGCAWCYHMRAAQRYPYWISSLGAAVSEARSRTRVRLFRNGSRQSMYPLQMRCSNRLRPRFFLDIWKRLATNRGNHELVVIFGEQEPKYMLFRLFCNGARAGAWNMTPLMISLPLFDISHHHLLVTACHPRSGFRFSQSMSERFGRIFGKS